jgi:ferredoxin
VYATAEKIKRPRYKLSSVLPVMHREHLNGKLWFEPAKCIRCGLCVYNSHDGFTFSGRGFSMQVVAPKESRANIGEELAELCPTGALYIK